MAREIQMVYNVKILSSIIKMFCDVCVKSKKTNGFTEGSINLKPSALGELRKCFDNSLTI